MAVDRIVKPGQDAVRKCSYLTSRAWAGRLLLEKHKQALKKKGRWHQEAVYCSLGLVGPFPLLPPTRREAACLQDG